jgi:Orsellinic acid/F9775 biosynthesis cluster protein D
MLCIDDKEQLLICYRSECGYALAVKHSQVTSHLRDRHQVPESDRRGLTRYLTSIYPKGFRSPTELPPRDDGSDTHPQLHVHDGFSCRECSYYTINYPKLSKHMSKNHLNDRQASRARIQDFYDDVYLQTWTNGATRRYWTVRKDG